MFEAKLGLNCDVCCSVESFSFHCVFAIASKLKSFMCKQNVVTSELSWFTCLF